MPAALPGHGQGQARDLVVPHELFGQTGYDLVGVTPLPQRAEPRRGHPAVDLVVSTGQRRPLPGPVLRCQLARERARVDTVPRGARQPAGLFPASDDEGRTAERAELHRPPALARQLVELVLKGAEMGRTADRPLPSVGLDPDRGKAGYPRWGRPRRIRAGLPARVTVEISYPVTHLPDFALVAGEVQDVEVVPGGPRRPGCLLPDRRVHRR